MKKLLLTIGLCLFSLLYSTAKGADTTTVIQSSNPKDFKNNKLLLGGSTVTVKFPALKGQLMGSDIKVKSASFVMRYLHEPDWTDVELEVLVYKKTGTGKDDKKLLGKMMFYGPVNEKGTRGNLDYKWNIDPEEVQKWLEAGDSEIDIIIERKYVAKGKNNKHPLYFFSPKNIDNAKQPRLIINYSFSGNVPPNPPKISSDFENRTLGKLITVAWSKPKILDLNTEDKVTYAIEMKSDKKDWTTVKQNIPSDTASTDIDCNDWVNQSGCQIRIRSIDDKGAFSPWSESGAFSVSNEVVSFWTEHAMVKASPDMRPSNNSAKVVKISAAKGEYEAGQLILNALVEQKNVKIRLPSLKSADGAEIPAEGIILYKEHFMDCRRASNRVGIPGIWADGLVPLVDPYYKEERNPASLTVKCGEIVPIWVEVRVPYDQKAGLYTGNITVTSDSGLDLKVPVEFKVWDFAIPVQTSVRSSFAIDPGEISNTHKKAANKKNMWRLYCTELLKHRLSVCTGWSVILGSEDKKTGKIVINTNQLDELLADGLDGKLLPDGEKFTALNIHFRWRGDKKREGEFRAECQKHFEKRGWGDRFYRYVIDEPKESQLKKVAEMCDNVTKYAPKIKALVTYGAHPTLDGHVDIYCPLINFYNMNYHFGGVDNWKKLKDKGAEVWWYTSMMSHASSKLPNYFIDAPTISPRIMQWIAYQYDIDGVLYYYMTYAFTRGDPWKNQFYFGANGDGTLFYPGYANKIGGKDDIPISSIRLKMVRDGIEDNEYFYLLEKAKGKQFAVDLCRKIARKPMDWDNDPEKLYQLRAQVAEILEKSKK